MKWAFPIATIIIGMLLVSMFLGTQFIALNTFLLVAFVYLLLAKFNALPKMIALPLSAKMATYAVVAVGLIGLFTGAFGIVSPLLTYEGLSAAVTGTVAMPASTAITSSTVRSDVTCAVSEELRGKTSTVIINAYDQAANNPYSAPVGHGQVFAIKNGQIANVTDTTAGSFSSYSVGDIITFKGGNAYYYVADKTECIDTQQKPIDLDYYAVASVGNMAISCYDDTGSAACTAATNNTQADHDLAIGAGGEKQYYLKLEVDTANVAFNLFAIAVGAHNDAKMVDLIGPDSGDTSAWTQSILPEFLSSASISADEYSAAANITGYDKVYTRADGPMLMTEWDSAKYKFKIEATSTDPTATVTWADVDIGIVCFLDAVQVRGQDGEMYLDFWDHGDSEANVGLNEEVYFPITAGTTADICHGLALE